MKYREAMQRIVETHLCVWGSFFEPLTNFEGLPRERIQEILLERGQKMWKIIKGNDLCFADIIRFSQEMEVICLLFLICVWGSVNEDVPIDEFDLRSIQDTLTDLCSGGVRSEDGLLNITQRLLIEGLKQNQLPESILFTLLNPQKFLPHP